MVVYGEHIEKDPTEGLYWQITAFFKSALCENARLFLSTGIVMTLVIFDFAGLALGYQALEVHPAIGFFLLVSDFDPLPRRARPALNLTFADISPSFACICV